MGNNPEPKQVAELEAKLEQQERWFRILDRQIRVLERERQKFAAVVNHTDAGFFLVDSSLRVLWANHVFRDRFGLPTPRGKNPVLSCNRVLCLRDDVCKDCPGLRPFRNGQVTHQEFQTEIDGRTRYLYATGMPVSSPEGEIDECIVMVQDVSDLEILRKSRAALAASEEQLRHSQKMEAVGKLAGGIAHDFNNLLTAITGHSAFLLDRLGPDDGLRKGVTEISTAAKRAAELTHQILAFSRKQMLQERVVDLHAVIMDTADVLLETIGEEVRLSVALDPDPRIVKIDPGQFEVVLVNLAANAREAMPSGGRLTIETAEVDLDEAADSPYAEIPRGRYVMLSVTDTGCGMTEEVRTRIFEPFFTTKNRAEGKGLGLSAVYGSVRQSRGHILVESEPGAGTTFRVFLPRETTSRCSPEAERAPVATEAPTGAEVVLLVDDDQAVRTLARDILEMYGYTVLEAADGVEAMEILDGNAGVVQLLLTDVVMPRMGGCELVRNIDRSDLPVVYMSGYTDGTIDGESLTADGRAFLQKPFTPEALARLVRETLDAV